MTPARVRRETTRQARRLRGAEVGGAEGKPIAFCFRRRERGRGGSYYRRVGDPSPYLRGSKDLGFDGPIPLNEGLCSAVTARMRLNAWSFD